MKVAIDKNTIEYIKDFKEFEYIYVFENEPLETLLKIPVKCLHKDKIDEVDINLTDYKIDCLKKTKVIDENWKEKPKLKENKFAIIIPNYNYQECLETCLKSILTQNYTNYEIIFIDDMSTDRSVKIAKNLIGDKGKVIELKQKRYNGGARNEGYLHISEDVDYVMYVDSDDWLANESVLKKINKKLQNNEDVLFIGVAYYKNGKTIDCYKPNYEDKYQAIRSWSGSCGKVIKKSLATRQECLYNEGTLKEDRNQHCRICIYMKDFNCLAECVYIWNRENTKSVTTLRNNLWQTSTIRHYADTLNLYLDEKGKDPRIDDYLKERVAKCENEIKIGGDLQW